MASCGAPHSPFQRTSPKERGSRETTSFRRFLNIALGSAVETDYHLLAARDLGLLEAAAHDDLAARTLEVRRMLGGLIKKVSATSGTSETAAEKAH